MDNMIFELFYGNLKLNSDHFIQDEAYRAAVERAAQLENSLLRTLQGQPRRDLSFLINDYETITGQMMPEFFALGFRTAVQLLCASFHSVYSS